MKTPSKKKRKSLPLYKKSFKGNITYAFLFLPLILGVFLVFGSLRSDSSSLPSPTPSPTIMPGNQRLLENVHFNNVPVGQYTEAQVETDFTHTVFNQLYDSPRAQIVPDPDGGNMLDILIEANTYTGVTRQWVVDFGTHYDELWLQYKVKFGTGFDFNYLGGKLPGLGGNPDPRATLVSCKPADGTNGFSARIMWRNKPSMNVKPAFTQYTYDQDKTETCGREGTESWFSGPMIQANQWYTITQHVKINTPGVADGTIENWVDGVKQNSKTDFNFRDAGQTWAINQFIFHSYFGGNEQKWAHTQDEHIYYKYFIVSLDRLM